MVTEWAAIDPYWIAERYHGTTRRAEFVKCLEERGVEREDADALWRVIDAAVDLDE